MAEEGIGKRLLDRGWLAARSTEVDLTGVELTTTHPPSAEQSPWVEAVVPGTVLATLVKNNLVRDPFYGLDNETIIDIGESGRDYYTFWFFTMFECKPSTNQHVDLNFRAINYSADVYLNGHKEVLPKGMFRRHCIDVTDILDPDGKNLLAVLVYPPDNPGKIPPDGGQGGDHEIGKDVAAQYVEGWDWMTPIRDRNTGIWDEVSLLITGPVKIIDPHLVSSFFDDYKRAYLHSTLELVNKSNFVAECSLSIQVGTEIDGDICVVEHLQSEHLNIAAGSHVVHTLPELFFYKPDLWWPNGMGKQPLYNVEITVDVENFGESDSWSHHFGFRKIESHIDSATGGRLFKVNGQSIFIRGGNWILSDGLLRLSKRRYETDIKFHAEMNFNMMRCWGGGLAERPEFYHYCDIYGLLVWQEFWITGDCDGRGIPVSNPDGPLDHELFLLCARDTVKLLRNHPSLALWVGGNEQVPPDDINTALKMDLQLHPYFESSTDLKFSIEDIYPVSKDPSEYLDGTRIYVQGSMWDGFANGKGDFTDGPYEIQNPENFFKDDFYDYGFNPEVGSVGMPVAATIRATLPQEGWNIPLFNKLDNGYVQEVPNPIWDYHKYIPYSKPGLVHDQILLYGTPKDLDDFCLKAQLVNYIQYRALLEGWTSRMWSKYTGVLIWKTQNPWTGLRGQFYDHLHEQTAGFYGCRCAAEPIHVQLNLATNYLEVVNTTSKELSDVAIESSVWDLEGACLIYEVSEKLTVPSKKTLSVSEMKYPKSDNPEPVYFLLLKLYRREDYGILSRNFYWLHLPGGDYKLLEPYKKHKVSLKITSTTYIRGSSYEVRMHVENTSKKPDSRTLHRNVIEKRKKKGFDIQSEGVHSVLEREHEHGLLEKVSQYFSTNRSGVKVTEINGAEIGVAFFLHFSVHASSKDNKEGEDTRILPVHYSDNYFSLVPGEEMAISLNFEVPTGVTPRISLHGWNYEGGNTVL
ncbi:glycoside hydrolase family 2 family protein [Dorcoceras hygrometricum]|uniref:Glycoside hydrolase family 2 family protein n=1 Tax=Dorcoceras hygrometricum TaxID=472368 RepID=A0A2Z7AS58_9LAMI|nr:glycoside hydrolase family 2 family protein [Dorcoceras hygrometricum]